MEQSSCGGYCRNSRILYYNRRKRENIRRNQRHLLKLRDPELLQIQCDIEPELDNTVLENNTQSPENCPATIAISNTNEKLPIIPQPPLLRRLNRIHTQTPAVFR